MAVDRADVVVIGAGVSGLSTAWYLARAGKDVVVVDKGMVGGEASGRNGGMISERVDEAGADTHGRGVAGALEDDWTMIWAIPPSSFTRAGSRSLSRKRRWATSTRNGMLPCATVSASKW